MTDERQLEWSFVAFIVAVVVIITLLFRYTPAYAENYDSPPTEHEINRSCTNYGTVTVSLLKDFKSGGDVGVRWLTSSAMTARMRDIMTPTIGVLLKNYKDIDEADARKLGYDSCMRHFKRWADRRLP